MSTLLFENLYLVNLRFVLYSLGSRSKFECRMRFFNKKRRRSDGTNNSCSGISSKSWLKNSGEFGISVRNVLPTETVKFKILNLFILFSLTELLNHGS